jgi:hypothetical protein
MLIFLEKELFLRKWFSNLKLDIKKLSYCPVRHSSISVQYSIGVCLRRELRVDAVASHKIQGHEAYNKELVPNVEW